MGKRLINSGIAVAVVILLLTACGTNSNKKKTIEYADKKPKENTESISNTTQLTETQSEMQTENETDCETETTGETECVTERESEINTEASSQEQSSNGNTETSSGSKSDSGSTFVYYVKTENRTTEESRTSRLGISIVNYRIDMVDVYSDGSSNVSFTYYTSQSEGTYNNDQTELYNYAVELVNSNMDSLNRVLENTNIYRAEVGVGVLTLDYDLCVAATMRSIEMEYGNYFQHTRYNGDECFQIFDQLGLPRGYLGENIAAGQGTADMVSEGWKNSEGHYRNMINSNFNKLGVGVCADGIGDYGIYWTQLFSS